jgi:diazepam-binding inhibitor (GABA receptor modulator, acyl-CoA-binding protein)
VQTLRENHMTLQFQFEQAQADAKTLSERPDNMTMLKLYSLYKQGSSGDVQSECPEMTDFVSWAKWNAWNKLKGTSPEAAQQQYIDLVESLKD